MAITTLQPFNLDTTANYTFANVTAGNVSGANLVSANYVTGTLTTAAQPNITSVGTLTGLTSNGVVNFANTSNTTLGAVGNVHITGGTNGQYLQTDGSGTLSWATVSSGSTSNISNGNSNVNIPAANGNVNISAVGNANVLVVTGTGANITGTLNVSGNATVGNLITSGSGGNLSNINVVSANTFIASANITAGNANLGNAVTANYFIGSGANLTSLPGGNVSGQVANALVAGTVYTNAQPNITSVGSLTGLTVSNATGVVNFTTTANVTLGAVGNLHISGGTSGQYLQTDGSGTLSWATVSSGSTSNISNGNSNVNIPAANGNINLTAVGNTTMVVTGTGVNVAGTLNVSGNTTVSNLISSGTGGNISNANVISANTFVASGNISANNINTTGSGGNIANANVISANTFTASGNITAGNANLGNAVVANYFIGNFYGTANLATYATTANAVAGGNVSGQVANALVAGTVYTNAQPNITSVGSLTGLTVSNATGVVNFTTTANVTLGAVGNLHISGGTSGQYLSTDGSGTLSWATVSSGASSNISNGNSNVNIPAANGNVNISAVGNANILVVTGTGVNVTGTLNTTGNTTVGNLFSSGSGGNISNVNVISANTFTASGNITAGNVVTSGSGGNISNANVISANTFTASANITAGNANLGNAVTANYFIGSGNNLSNIQAGNITGQVANALVAGTVYTNAQPNITSVGSLTGLTVSNATGVVNFTTTANVTLGAVGNLHISGGTSGQYLSTDGSGTLSWATVSSGSTSNISNGNSNVNIPAANGNVNISAVGNANILVVTGTGVNVTGTLNTTGNTTVGNLFSSGSGGNISNVNVISANTFTASGNITAGNVVTSGSGGNISNANVISANTFTATANITAGNANLGNAVVANYFIGNFYGTANLATYATTANAVAGGNVSGQVANALVAGTVYTNAQPNITSVGSLTGLTVSNATGVVNFTTTANVTLGAVGNLHISGGTSGQYLSTDGSGTLSWATVSSGSTSNISNGNSNVNIPAANGNVNISAAGNANILVVTGTGANVTGTLNVTGNTTVANLATTGSGGNISNVNVVSANTFTASGNVTAGNIVTSGSGGNITGGNVISANTFTASGNITAGNANLGNAVVANYFIGNFYGTANLATYATTANAVAGGNVSGQVANALVAGTVYTNAQPNITSVGSLTGLTVSNATGIVNFTTTANVTLGAVGNLHISGGTSGQYLSTDGSGTLSWATVSSGASSNISNGNSNVNIPAANGNINLTAVGNTTMVVTGTGVNIAGTLNATGNASLGNLVTTGSGGNIANANVISANTFTASGNITAGNANLGNAVVANYFVGNFYGTANLATYATTANAVAGGNVSGQVSNALVAGTVYTNAQPNITSVGSLTGLTVSNATGVVNFTTTANVTLGAVGNLHISGGTSGQYLSTDGSGTLSWATVASVTASNIANGNSNVNIPAANGNVNISAVGNANVLVVTGTGANITGTANITGNVSAGNITAGSGTGGTISGANLVSANFFTGTLTTAAQPNITSVGSLTGLTVSNATGVVNFTTTANVTLGAVGNLHISGGTTGQYLQTDGSGTLTWATVTSGASSNISNGNSNVNIPAANGNINLTAVGNTTMVVTGTGVNVAGTLNATGNANAGNIGATGGVFTTVAGSLTTASQPNITSVGSLTSLTVTGNANVGNLNVSGNILDTTGTLSIATTGGTNGNLSLSADGTGRILLDGMAWPAADGTSGYVLQTDGANSLSWVAQSGGGGGGSNIANGTSNVAIATSGGNVTTSVAGNANIVVVTGTGANINGYATVTGNVSFSGANVSLGSVSNLHIDGGTSGYVLQTDGAGTLSWVAQSGGGGGGASISNGTSNINIPTASGNITAGVSGNANVMVLANTGLTINGNITTGSGTGGNITGVDRITANYITVGGANLGALSNLTITGGTTGYYITTNGAGGLSWTAAAGPSIVDNTSSSTTYYPIYATATSGGLGSAGITSTKLQFVPSTGQLTVQDLNTLSDMTLKENPENILDPMSVLSQLFGMGFTWSDTKKKSYGLMAQMVEQILPELVSTNAQGKKAVNYIPIIAFLIEAVKKQQEDIDALKKR